MTNSIEVRRGDWEKFKAYREEFGRVLLEANEIPFCCCKLDWTLTLKGEL